MGVCDPLMPDNPSYASSANLPSDSLRNNLAWWVVTRRTLKNTKPSKIVCAFEAANPLFTRPVHGSDITLATSEGRVPSV